MTSRPEMPNMAPNLERPPEEPNVNERRAAPHPPETPTIVHDDLNAEFFCDRCRAVDWASLPNLAADWTVRFARGTSDDAVADYHLRRAQHVTLQDLSHTLHVEACSSRWAKVSGRGFPRRAGAAWSPGKAPRRLSMDHARRLTKGPPSCVLQKKNRPLLYWGLTMGVLT